MRRLGLILYIIVIGSTLTFSQSKLDRTVIATVGKEKITYGELKKNMLSGANEKITLDDMEEFLPVYLEYKAKIQFAEKEGVLEDPELMSELSIYAKQAAYSHWLDKKIKQTEFNKYFERASTELKSRHILISVPQNSAPKDTLEAYSKLIEARNKFLNGADFSKLDSEYSSTQNGRSMGGDLPWFSVGTTVKEFEDVIFSLKIGEVSMPFRTQFGYHIVHLQDKREKTLSRNVSHIFTRTGSQDAKKNIELAYESLKNGNPWAETALKYSEDNLSSSNGGNIGWINYGRYNSSFVDSVLSVDPELDFSKPIKTVYGFHIFKIDSVQTFNTEQERKDSYMKEFMDSPNFKKSNSFVVNWLKNNYSSKLINEAKTKYLEYLNSQDTTKINNISIPSFSNQVVYTFNKNEYKISDLHNYLKDKHGNAPANSVSNSWVNDFVTYIIDSKIVELTISEFSDFQSILDNYKKGLAVYQINDQYLWSAATVDTSKLKEIFRKNPTKYTYPERYFYHMLSALNDTTLTAGIKFINENGNPDSVRSNFPKISVNKDTTGIFTDDPFSRLQGLQENSFSDRFEYRKRRAVFYLNKILPERPMEFHEAFNRLLADYQPKREELWLNNLKKRFKIKPNYKKLRSTFKKDQNL